MNKFKEMNNNEIDDDETNRKKVLKKIIKTEKDDKVAPTLDRNLIDSSLREYIKKNTQSINIKDILTNNINVFRRIMNIDAHCHNNDIDSIIISQVKEMLALFGDELINLFRIKANDDEKINNIAQRCKSQKFQLITYNILCLNYYVEYEKSLDYKALSNSLLWLYIARSEYLQQENYLTKLQAMSKGSDAHKLDELNEWVDKKISSYIFQNKMNINEINSHGIRKITLDILKNGYFEKAKETKSSIGKYESKGKSLYYGGFKTFMKKRKLLNINELNTKDIVYNRLYKYIKNYLKN
jgi:hypothetical protein